jgi:hypothetical protein
MGELVNLRMAKKRRASAQAAADAQANRVAYGRTKAEKQVAESERKRAGTLLDQARLDKPPVSD